MGAVYLDRALAIDGWMAPRELEWLANIARLSSKIIEVGSYKGRSTRVLCDNTYGHVTAIDPWDGPYITDKGKVLFDQAVAWPEFQANLADADNLTAFRGTFADFALINKDTDYDFIFIDGDHRFEHVVHDINLGLTILKDGGILAGHDYTHEDWPAVRRVVDAKFPHRETLNSIWWITKS